MPFPSRRTEALRKGRISSPGAIYFLTWCTANRVHSLAGISPQTTTRQAIANLELSENGLGLAASIMPDHVHLLLKLGSPLTVSQVIGKLKSAITRVHGEIKWQENFFEHQLRPDDPIENYAFYIFMNPYCAGICDLERIWPGWISSGEMHWGFEVKLRVGGLSQPGWLEQAGKFGATLPRGAD